MSLTKRYLKKEAADKSIAMICLQKLLNILKVLSKISQLRNQVQGAFHQELIMREIQPTFSCLQEVELVWLNMLWDQTVNLKM
jgi:hypothetical protein